MSDEDFIQKLLLRKPVDDVSWQEKLSVVVYMAIMAVAFAGAVILSIWRS